MRPKSRSTTYKAQWIIDLMSLKKLCDHIGVTHNTVYRRLVEHNWKQSEIQSIEMLYEKYRKDLRHG